MSTISRTLAALLLVFIAMGQILVLVEPDENYQELLSTCSVLILEENREAARILIDYLSNRFPLFSDVYELRRVSYTLLAKEHGDTLSIGRSWDRIQQVHPIMFFSVPPFASVSGVLLLAMALSVTGMFLGRGVMRRIVLLFLFSFAMLSYFFILVFQLRYAIFTEYSLMMANAFASIPVVSYALAVIIAMIVLFFGYKPLSDGDKEHVE